MLVVLLCPCWKHTGGSRLEEVTKGSAGWPLRRRGGTEKEVEEVSRGRV